MRKLQWMGVAGFVALALAAGEARPGDKDALVGSYVIVSGEKDGKPEPEERVKGTTVHFGPGTITVTDNKDKKTYAASYKLDTSKKPWAITMTSTLAPSVGEVAHGLVEQNGTTVKLIYALPKGDTPTDFKTKGNQLMFVLKKAEKKDK